MKLKLTIALSFLLFLYLFLVFDTNFYGVDDPIYFAYPTSIMEDGDLNVVNQYYLPLAKFNVSRTYNLTDFHGHGGVLLWVPFYAYARFVSYIITKFNLPVIGEYEALARCALSFSSVALGFFTILLTFILCRVFFSNKIAVCSTLAIFLGTPFFYFMLFDVANANMVASLFSVLSIWFCSYAVGMKKSHWFLYGVFFSICMVIKIDLWFQIVFILSFFVILLLRKQTTWMNGVCFLAGLLPVLILKQINDYIKYGTFHIGEAAIGTFKYFYFFEQLFSSYHGFFYTSPIFYICLLGLIFSAVCLLKSIKKDGIRNLKDESMKDLFLFSLSVYLFMKVLIMAWEYSWGGGTPGARLLLTEFPVFVLLCGRALQREKKSLAYLLVVSSVLCVFWNFLIISEFMTGVDLEYIVKGFPNLITRVKAVKLILIPLVYIKGLALKLKLCLPLVVVVSGIAFSMVKLGFAKPIHPSFWYSRAKNNRRLLKLFSIFTIYLCTAYTIITAFNLVNNRKNVERLKEEGFFKNARIVSRRHFEEEENVGVLYEMIWYYNATGDIDKANKLKKDIKQVYGRDE